MKKQIIKKLLHKLPSSIQYIIEKSFINVKNKDTILKWKENGGIPPPPSVYKQRIVQNYQKISRYNVFIETGTYLGEMIDAQKGYFKKIISIELGEDLWLRATIKFKEYKHISIKLGDSGKILHRVMEEVTEPAIFWLDGHYSEGITAKGELECPIIEELGAIFCTSKLNHIILIDDARYFKGENDYPTIEQLVQYVYSKNPTYNLSVEDDIIRLLPDSTLKN